MLSKISYKQKLKVKEKEWESLCIRCGGCCGAYDDPCQHLRKGRDDFFYCTIYNKRFGNRISNAGEEFRCVPIKNILKTRWKNDYLCAYKKYLKSPWLKS